MSERGTLWTRVLRSFVELPAAIIALTGLLVVAGLVVLPFELDLGGLPRDPVPVDAIPDLGENQQIVFTEWPGRSPRDVDDQIGYPLSAALLGLGGVRSVRSTSMFGFSNVYVIFEEGVDFETARFRVLEKLAALPESTLPAGVSPKLGPEATGLGQIFWYTLIPRLPSGAPAPAAFALHELRSIQDFTVKPALQSVGGVAEVSSVGGFVREYHVDIDAERMRAHGVTLERIARAVRGSNLDVGARTFEINRVEYVIRGVGFIESLDDLREVVVGIDGNVPVRLRDVAHVHFGPAPRRGALDDAGAPAVGGVVVSRYGENPRAVIERVRERVQQLQESLPTRVTPEGVAQVTVVPFYDRAELIDETLGTLSDALLQQILITVLVVLVMLRHLRSALVIASVLPLSVLGAFLAMRVFGVDANLMSLAGIAIAIGTMVDMGIVITESVLVRLRSGEGARRERLIAGAAEVAPAVVVAALTTLLTFLPVLGLEGSAGKLFRPLALTKTFAVLAAVIVSLVVLPVLAGLFIGEGGRRDELRAQVALGLSGAATALFFPWLGAALIGFALLRLLEPRLPPALRRWPERLEIGITALVAGLVLADAWRPLGAGAGFVPNLLFVILCVGGTLVVAKSSEALYPRLLAGALRRPLTFLLLPAGLLLLAALVVFGARRIFPEPLAEGALADTFPGLGREFMPPFDEGAFLYMPTTMPHASIGQAQDLLQDMDAAIAAVPEVDRVVGKLGRAESALDPAPISMFETIITYHPEYRVEPDGTRVRQWREHIRSPADIWSEVERAAGLPGLTRAPLLMPIAARLVMLQSGMRAPFGVELRGPSLDALETAGRRLEDVLREVPELRPETVFADRLVGKPYLELEIDRREIARCGLTVADVQAVIQTGIGGAEVTRTVEGRERYAVRVRYGRRDRDSVEALKRVLVATPTCDTVPLEQFTEFRYVKGPQMIRSEDTFLTTYVLFDKKASVSELGAVEAARSAIERAISEEGALPEGVTFDFAGTWENQVRSEARLRLLVPLALVLVFVLLYLQFRRASTTLIVASGVIVAASGGFILLWLWGQPALAALLGEDLTRILDLRTVNLSVAVWVGFIALAGIATDDGVLMSTYLEESFAARRPGSREAIHASVLEAGQRRIRPCLMTTATTLVALLPVLTATGRGADVMRPVALPIFGGMIVELVTLFVVPVLSALRAQAELRWTKQGVRT